MGFLSSMQSQIGRFQQNDKISRGDVRRYENWNRRQ